MAAQSFNLPQRLQDLPPRAARLCLAVQRFTQKELLLDLTGKRILVGFSHGLDSTALLLILHYLSPRLGMQLAAAHLDHQLRAESAAEAQAARELCARLNIPFTLASVNVTQLAEKKGIGIEEAGRTARLELFAEIRAKTGCHWIALGHQLNDLAEDILMRLIRGAAWPGLGGMTGRDDRQAVFRPMLATPRGDLKNFLLAVNAPWQVDASNADPKYLRNRVRNSILPLFLEENPNFLTKALELWRSARLAEAENRQEPPKDNSLRREDLINMSKNERLALYKEILQSLGPGQALNRQLLTLDEAYEKSATAQIQFPGKKNARVTPKGIWFCRAKPGG